MYTLTGAEMEPIQNFKTGLVRPVRTVDRSGPVRPVHKTFQTGKN